MTKKGYRSTKRVGCLAIVRAAGPKVKMKVSLDNDGMFDGAEVGPIDNKGMSDSAEECCIPSYIERFQRIRLD